MGSLSVVEAKRRECANCSAWISKSRHEDAKCCDAICANDYYGKELGRSKFEWSDKDWHSEETSSSAGSTATDETQDDSSSGSSGGSTSTSESSDTDSDSTSERRRLFTRLTGELASTCPLSC